MLCKGFKMISIVMAYKNRLPHLLYTLETIRYTKSTNFEIIIVDDFSDQEHDPTIGKMRYPQLPITVIKMSDLYKEKSYHNPCVVYNVGFRYTSGDKIIIQNPECCHIGDIISYVENNLNIGDYFSFNCYSTNEQETNVMRGGNGITFNNIGAVDPNVSAWYNHPTYRPVMYHFMSAITRVDLKELNGFDERFSDGVSYDDDEFVLRIKRKNLNIRFIESPLAVHQYHTSQFPSDLLPSLVEKNRVLLESIQNETQIDNFNQYAVFDRNRTLFKNQIIDCFMFGLEYELDLLEIRLEYLDPIVDHFVLVEARFTQLGNSKELYFEKNKQRFSKYLHKIVHVIVDNPISTAYGSWDNEHFQRNNIRVGLDKLDLNRNDIVMISDLDEIPNHEAIKLYHNNNVQLTFGLEQDMYYYYLNYKANYKWCGSHLTRWHILLGGTTPQEIRNQRFNGNKLHVHGGWHFSYLGGLNAVMQKLNSVCESNMHEQFKKNQLLLETSIKNKKIHFNNEPLEYIQVSTSDLPNTIKNKQSVLTYKKLIKQDKVTIECVTLIFKSTKYLDFIIDQMKRYCVNFDNVEVIISVVGNNASTNVKEHLTNVYPDVKFNFYESDPNAYYINRVYQAYNYAAMISTADYICFLNSDMAFSPDWLKNLYKHINANRVVTSQLVESGKLLSAPGTFNYNFGTSYSTYDEHGFLEYSQKVSKDEVKPGILYMPSLINRELFLLAGGFPPGNVYHNGIGTGPNGNFSMSGDQYFFDNVLRDKFGIEHLTSCDSIVYHIQEGEKDE